MKADHPDGRGRRARLIVVEDSFPVAESLRDLLGLGGWDVVGTAGSVLAWEADVRTWQFTYVGPQAPEVLGHPIEADWTAVCNQILAEAGAAENVLTVFGHIRNI